MSWVEQRQQAAMSLRGDKMLLYRIVRSILKPLFGILFRPVIVGSEHIPLSGAAVVTANHRSFWDSAFQALASPRPIRWMGKSELFRNPILGRLFVHLGAFPVVRGGSDGGAIQVARVLLEAGEMVALFPEGTRVREGLGEPKRGAARLALEAGVDTIPMSIVGTERGQLRRALWRRGAYVRIVVHEPIPPLPINDTTPEQDRARYLMRDLVWPKIKDGVHGLEGHRKQALAAGAGALILAGLGIRGRKKKQ